MAAFCPCRNFNIAEDTKNLLDPSDRCGTSTAVRLQNVTIDPERAFSQTIQIIDARMAREIKLLDLETGPLLVSPLVGNISKAPSEGTIKVTSSTPQ
jgi:hypothetical protein